MKLVKQQVSHFHIGFMTLLLLSLTVYNSSFTVARLVMVGLFFVIPIYYFIIHGWSKLAKENWILLMFSISWCFYLFFSFLYNSGTFKPALSGPTVELLTPVLMLSAPFIIELINRTPQSSRVLIEKWFLSSLIVFLSFEVLYRYVLEPACFMNYWCRFEAKTVGFFSTTNALATSLIMVLIPMFERRFNIKQFLLIGILITTIARAAIVSYIIAILSNAVLKSNVVVKLSIIFLFVLLMSYVFMENPLGLLNDGSLKSKFAFFYSAFDAANKYSLAQFLFGYGASFEKIVKVVDVGGYSPHAPMLKAYFYFGFIGLIFYIISLVYFYIISGGKLFITLLALIICSIGGAPIYLPTILVSLFLINTYRSQNNHGERNVKI